MRPDRRVDQITLSNAGIYSYVGGPDSAGVDRKRDSKMRARKMFLGIVYLSLVPYPLLAHHSATMFDVTQERVVQGVVTNFAWKNPHSYLTIRTSGENPVDQVIEVGPPATLRPLGLTEDAVRVGDAVSVRVNPAKRGTIVLGRELTKTDGSIWPLLLTQSAVDPSRCRRRPRSRVPGSRRGFSRWRAAYPVGRLRRKHARTSLRRTLCRRRTLGAFR